MDELLTGRAASEYADFLIPHLRDDLELLDVGCAEGSITLGLARSVGRAVGVDALREFAAAETYAAERGIGNVEFTVGDAYQLEVRDSSFDVVFAHSVLEALARPADALTEMHRVLRPGGLVAVASVEYGGLVLAGPQATLLRRFYAIRERLWQLGGSDPYLGRELRGLLTNAGFVDVVATTKIISYGTDDAVLAFGRDRAADCRDEWYVDGALRNGLADRDELAAMEAAWKVWSEATDAYFGFAWCRALGRCAEAAHHLTDS